MAKASSFEQASTVRSGGTFLLRERLYLNSHFASCLLPYTEFHRVPCKRFFFEREFSSELLARIAQARSDHRPRLGLSRGEDIIEIQSARVSEFMI